MNEDIDFLKLCQNGIHPVSVKKYVLVFAYFWTATVEDALTRLDSLTGPNIT